MGGPHSPVVKALEVAVVLVGSCIVLLILLSKEVCIRLWSVQAARVVQPARVACQELILHSDRE